MQLSIVIPALDEEEAIGRTVQACLDAAPAVCAEAGLAGVELIVVDDGSTDRTAAIVRGFPDVRLLQHAVNRGYGAAIQTGFEQASGELLAFLDADGTCDPRHFGRLAKTLLENEADVVSGNRLGEGNQMPAVRRLGNRIFAFLINLLAPQHVEDLASGMRVLRRSALPRLAPLPEGLHYTPAMSAKALFDESLRLVEAPIPYAERVGESKLSVIRDGQRFLQVLMEIALSYRPFRFFGTAGFLLLAVATAYGVRPAQELLRHRVLPEEMIYRIHTIVVLTAAGITLLATGLIAERATAIVHGTRRRRGLLHRACDLLLLARPGLVGTLLLLGAVLLNLRGISSYLRSGRVEDHWIFAVSGGLLGLCGVLLLAFGALKSVLGMLAERHAAREGAAREGAAAVDRRLD